MNGTETKLTTQIDQNLRRIFEEDARAELPERLLDLLDKLDEIEVPAPTGDGMAPPDGADGDPK